MQTARATSHSGRILALQAKHAALDEQIEEAQKHVATADDLLRYLKREKLKVKDQIEEEGKGGA